MLGRRRGRQTFSDTTGNRNNVDLSILIAVQIGEEHQRLSTWMPHNASHSRLLETSQSPGIATRQRLDHNVELASRIICIGQQFTIR